MIIEKGESWVGAGAGFRYDSTGFDCDFGDFHRDAGGKLYDATGRGCDFAGIVFDVTGIGFDLANFRRKVRQVGGVLAGVGLGFGP